MLYILTAENKQKNIAWILVVLLTTMAFWSDLQSVYAIIIIFLFLFLNKNSRKDALLVSFLMIIVNSAIVITMWNSGVLDDFIRDGIKFNLEIYSKYTNAVRILWFNQILDQMLHVFYVYRFDWFQLVGWADLGALSDPNRSWLTGGLYRLSLIVLAMFLMFKRKLTPAIFVYLYGSTLIVRASSYFHSLPFVMTGLFSLSFLIADGPYQSFVFSKKTIDFESRFPPIISKIPCFVIRLLCFMGVWLGVYGIYQTFRGSSYTFFDFQRNTYDQIVREIRDVSCNNMDVYLGFFPGDPMVHFLSGLHPVSRFTYLFPWTAEAGLEETINQLNQKKSIVWIDMNGIIWSRYRVKDYLFKLIQHLDNNYLLIRDGVYVSRDLASDCLFNSTKIPDSYFNYIGWFIKMFEEREGKNLIILTENVDHMSYFKSVSSKVRLVNPNNGMLWPANSACYLAFPDSLKVKLLEWGVHGTWESIPFMGLRWQMLCEEDSLASFRDLRPLETWEKGIALLRFTVRGELVPGGLLEVEHLWRYEDQKLGEPIVFYNHLLKDGQLVAQADGVSVSSDQWQKGDVIGARFIIRTPDPLPSGVYQLRVGLYTWPSLQRLTTLHGEDGFILQIWKR